MTSGSTLEISRDQLGKDAFSRGASELRALELCNTSLTWSPSALHANSARCSRRLPGVRQQELIRGAAMNSQADNATARECDARALFFQSQFDYFEAHDEVIYAIGGTFQ
jgi:hypothetical protein